MEPGATAGAEVFVSYASRDRPRVIEIVRRLETAGVRAWIDAADIEGGTNYGSEIVQGIRNCKVVLLMCTDAALRSRNVKQEIQVAWNYERPYLPLLLEPTSFPEQLQYWLEGWQWIEVVDHPAETWLPKVVSALARFGVGGGAVASRDALPPPPVPSPGLAGLRSLARLTDQIWPLPADRAHRGRPTRGLGAPQDDVQHGHRLGSRVCLAVEFDRNGHMLLLDEGPEGIIYCLCPSHFAPDTHLTPGRHYVPQPRSRYDALVVTGKPGREHLLAILTEAPLGLDWMPADPRTPARVLTPTDVATFLAVLRELGADRWVALSTYFDVIA